MSKAVDPTKRGKGSRKIIWLASAVVLIILLLVILNPNHLIYTLNPGETAPFGTSCIGETSFSCSNPILTTYGTVNITLAQDSGVSLYNIELSCLSTTNSLVYASNPSPSSASYTPLPNATFGTGDIITVKGLTCYTQADKLGPIPMGFEFVGLLYVNYTSSPENVSAENPWHTAKVATFSVKAS